MIIMLQNKKGFTLIELLVVIGILAVLAAIAIPTVAGLIDRANASSDKTNANEMTNAVDRFASEYELYKNDISMGIIPNDDMDTAQGRVHNIIGAISRADITELETSGSDDAVLIDKDTKYPMTAEMVKSVVQNYMKTSSTTFEPKQSDMCYWYSPECGVVVVAGHNSSVAQKNELIVSGKDAKGNSLDGDTVWFDLTCTATGSEEEDEEENIVLAPIPVGGVYTVAATNEVLTGDGSTVMFPAKSAEGDVYSYGDYNYTYVVSTEIPVYTIEHKGWQVAVKQYGQSTYGTILSYINNEPVIDMFGTFSNCRQMKTAPAIPSTVKYMVDTFNCSGITTAPEIPYGVETLFSCFNSCVSLETAPVIPSTVKNMDLAFSGCIKLKVAPVIPEGVESAGSAFSECRIMTLPSGNYVLPDSLTSIGSMFGYCPALEGTIVINEKMPYSGYEGFLSQADFSTQELYLAGNSPYLDNFGADYTYNYCAECNGHCNNSH